MTQNVIKVSYLRNTAQIHNNIENSNIIWYSKDSVQNALEPRQRRLIG